MADDRFAWLDAVLRGDIPPLKPVKGPAVDHYKKAWTMCRTVNRSCDCARVGVAACAEWTAAAAAENRKANHVKEN